MPQFFYQPANLEENKTNSPGAIPYTVMGGVSNAELRKEAEYTNKNITNN